MLWLLAQAGPPAHFAGPSGGYAIGWFTLSLINAGLAQSKGRSGLLWWLVSLLLGPIATLIIVAVLDSPRPVPPAGAKYVEREL